MIRPLTCVTVLLACGSGLYLYQTKHQAQVLDKQIEHAVKLAAATRMQTRELTAAWTLLGSPDRLQQLSDQYLDIKAVSPSQFVAMSDLDSKLPAPRALEAPPATTPDDTGTGTIPLATTEPPPVAAPPPTAVASLTAAMPPAVTVFAPPAISSIHAPPAPASAAPAPPPPATQPTDAAKAATATPRPADRKPIDISHPPRDTAQRDAAPRDTTPRDVTPREPPPARDVALTRPTPPRPITPPMVAQLERPPRQASPSLPPMPVSGPTSGSFLGMAHTRVAAPVPLSTNGN